MAARYGVAIAGAVVVLVAVALIGTWPGAGHPDDAPRSEVDAGAALAPATEPPAPEEPSPAPSPFATPPSPSSVLGGAPPVVVGAPPTSAPATPPADTTPSMVTYAGPPFTGEEAYDAANVLVSAIEARRVEIEAQLADATRRGDTRLSARLTQQRDGLTASLDRARGLLADLDRQRAAAVAPTSPVPSGETAIRPGP